MIITNSPKISSTKIKVVAMMLLILVSSIWFALHSQPVQPVRVVIPNQISMRRESFDITPEFEEALSVSLKRGYLQGVNWEWAEVA